MKVEAVRGVCIKCCREFTSDKSEIHLRDSGVRPWKYGSIWFNTYSTKCTHCGEVNEFEVLEYHRQHSDPLDDIYQ